MRHPRSRIREAFLQRLKAPLVDGTYRTAARDRVFKSRWAPIDVNDDEELPAILIYLREDSRDPRKDYGIEGQDTKASSELRIVVEAIVRGGTLVDDACDDIAFEIEQAFEGWDIPEFEGALIRLGDSDIDVATEFRKPVGAIGLIYHVWYEREWNPSPDGGEVETDAPEDEPETPEPGPSPFAGAAVATRGGPVEMTAREVADWMASDA